MPLVSVGEHRLDQLYQTRAAWLVRQWRTQGYKQIAHRFIDGVTLDIVAGGGKLSASARRTQRVGEAECCEFYPFWDPDSPGGAIRARPKTAVNLSPKRSAKLASGKFESVPF